MICLFSPAFGVLLIGLEQRQSAEVDWRVSGQPVFSLICTSSSHRISCFRLLPVEFEWFLGYMERSDACNFHRYLQARVPIWKDFKNHHGGNSIVRALSNLPLCMGSTGFFVRKKEHFRLFTERQCTFLSGFVILSFESLRYK